MTWTRELPKESGWYWLQHVGLTGTDDAEIVRVDQDRKVWCTRYDFYVYLSEFENHWWYGPLTPPEREGE